MINGVLENTPIRQIEGKAELLGGSATLKYCRNMGWVDEFYPVPHDIKISAKSENLLDLSGITTNGNNGYGIPRVEGNNLIITPNASGTFYSICPHTDLYSQLEDGETYTFSMDSVSGHGSNWGWRISYNDGTTAPVNYSLKKTIKWSKDITWVYFYFGMPYKSTEEITITNLQVRKGSEVLPFVPYVDTSNVAITATGRNLFLCNDFEKKVSTLTYKCKDGVISIIATAGLTTTIILSENVIPFSEWLPNQYIEPGTYTFTGEWLSIRDADKNKKIYLELLLDDGTSDTFYSGDVKTFTQRAKIISVRAEQFKAAQNVDTISCRLMLEYGTAANPYEKAFQYDFTQSGVISEKINYLFIQSSIEDTSASICINYLKPYNQEFKATDDLQSITVDRVGANKFFGFGVCQKATINIMDKERKHNIANTGIFNISFNDVKALPWFYNTEIKRDENTNTISVIAYDALYGAEKHTVSELGLVGGYTIATFIGACGKLLGVDVIYPGAINEFNLNYESGANFDGTETIRAALDAVAEVTQTIYFMNNENKLVFVRLDKFGDAVYTIDKTQYFTLNSKDRKTLGGICHATELGDNVSAIADDVAEVFYVRNNPFWEMREDIATLVDNALTAAKDYSFDQFNCSWRGNYLLEIGDKIDLVTKDDKVISAYLLNDSISYKGGYKQESKWEYATQQGTAANPTTLGEIIKQTYAKVDKQNKQIDIVASEVAANTNSIAALQINTDGISASVSSLETKVDANNENINNSLVELSNKVSATMTDTQIKAEIEKTISENGASKVTTTTGFIFDEKGLTISKSDSEISTIITENGMEIKGDKVLLTANNEGVKAEDLHATSYLIIGKNSRFEDYVGNRTGCFWIGG